MRALHRSFWLLAADALCRGSILWLHIFLVRRLDLGEYGAYSFVTAWSSYFVMFIGSGLDVILSREATVGPETLRRLARLVLGYRLLIALGAIALNLLLVFTVPKLAPFRMEMLVYQPALLLSAVSLDWWAVGRGKTIVLCAGRVLQVAVQCVIAAGLVWWQPVAASALVGVLMGMGAFRLLVGIDFLRSEEGRVPHPHLVSWKQLLTLSLPLLLGAAAGEIITSMDQVMLGIFSTQEELGRYAACYKIVGLGLAVPGAFMTVGQPKIAQALAGNPTRAELLTILLKVFLAALGCLLLPLAVLNIFPDFWFNLLFSGKTQVSFSLLTGLSLSCVALAVAYLINVTLTIWHGQWLVTRAMLAAGLFNVALNFWWIPSYGATGAAWATFAAITLLCVYSGANLARKLLTLPKSKPPNPNLEMN